MGVPFLVVGTHNVTTKVTKLSVGKVSQIIKNTSLEELVGNPIVLNVILVGISVKLLLSKPPNLSYFNLLV